MAKNELPEDFFPFGLQSMPGGSGANGFADLLYSMGIPVGTQSGDVSIFQQMMEENLAAGRPPFEGFPEGYGPSTGEDTLPGADEEFAPGRDPRMGNPNRRDRWWLNQDRYGRRPVSRVGGLLDE